MCVYCVCVCGGGFDIYYTEGCCVSEKYNFLLLLCLNPPQTVSQNCYWFNSRSLISSPSVKIALCFTHLAFSLARSLMPLITLDV